MTGVGTSWSIASTIVQRPSPESDTWPLSPSRSLPSAANAFSASSHSHERTTEPRFQSPATSLSSIGNFDLCISSKPSAYACMIPYSTPLWTIFTKWPAPASPKWREPPGELVDGLLRRVAGRHHQPDEARRVELGDEVVERGGAGRPVPLGRADRLLGEVERDHLVVRVAVDAMDHVAAHLAETDEAELHLELLLESGDGAAEVAGGQEDAGGRQAVAAQRLQVAVGLRVEQRAERERHAGDGEVDLAAVAQLEEAAGRRAALVELAGRVQEARPVAPRRRDAVALDQHRAQPRDCGVDRVVERQVAH